MELKAEYIQVSRCGRVGTEQVVAKASCTAQESSLSFSPHCWSLAKLKMDLGVTTSATPVGMLELLGSAIVAAAKKRAAITRTTRAPGKLTVHELFTAASSMAGAAAAFCFSVAACFLTFCLAPACSTAADFSAFASSFASSFASAAFAFAALVVNSFAVSSASKDSWRKFFGIRIDMPKPSA